ncbi:hypothetical protein FGG78_20015 [Thioclava sp. BHET1]|nr:hypothetical protein FGG78_20015 [Thioclava sp. BHET1]
MANSVYTTMFNSLVEQGGGGVVAAQRIRDLTGLPVSDGTITRICNGSLHVPITWGFALEDATGNHCMTKYRIRMLEGRGVAKAAPRFSPLDHAGAMHKESFEAVQAILGLIQNAVSPEAALKEVMDLEDLTRSVREGLEAQIRDGVVATHAEG